MHDGNRISGNGGDKQLEERIERLIQAIEQFTRLFNDWAAEDLNGRFPYGKAVDRWRRRA